MKGLIILEIRNLKISFLIFWIHWKFITEEQKIEELIEKILKIVNVTLSNV